MAAKYKGNRVNPNFEYEQRMLEQKNPGGAWVDGFYIPPGLDFSGFMPQQVATAEAPASRGEQIALPPVENPVVPTADELRAEAAKRASAEIDTNADYLQGTAGFFNQLGQKLTNYDQQKNFMQSDYARNDLELERNRDKALLNRRTNLADRGITFGGLAVDTVNKDSQEFDVRKLNNVDQLNRSLSGIELNRNAAQQDYENNRLGLRRNIIDTLIDRYSKNAVANVSK